MGYCAVFLAPEQPIDMSLKDLINSLSKHLEPKPLIIVEGYHFHKHDQTVEETLVEYIAELRQLATKYKFENSLEDALFDNFVCGVRSESIHQRLLSEAELTFMRAIKITTMMESARKNTQSLKNTLVPWTRT